jgi:hypothetical protein
MLLGFFQNCKQTNEYFYWDAQTDTDTRRIKNIFWSHASQRAECRDFGDVITFDTTHMIEQKQDATSDVCWIKSSVAECSVRSSPPSRRDGALFYLVVQDIQDLYGWT